MICYISKNSLIQTYKVEFLKQFLSYVSHNGLDHKKNYNNILSALFDIEIEENHILKREIAGL